MTRFVDHSSDEEYYPNNELHGNSSRRPKTVLDVLHNDRRFTRVFNGLTNRRQLKDDLTDPRAELTIFAPTDEAFKKLRKDLKKDLDEDELQDILEYLVVPKCIDSRDIKKKGVLVKTSLKLKSLNKQFQRIHLAEESGKIFLNHKVQITESDMKASNGVIHVVEEVPIPPKKVGEQIDQFSSQFSTVLKAFKETKLLDEVNEDGITVFLPTNSAFQNLGCEATKYLFSDDGKEDLKKILKLHISERLAYSTVITGEEHDHKHERDRWDDDKDFERPDRGDRDHGRRRGNFDDDYGRGGRRNYPRRRGGYDDRDDDYNRGRRHYGDDEYERYPRGPDRGYDDDSDFDRRHPRRRGGYAGHSDDDEYDYERPGRNRRQQRGWDEDCDSDWDHASIGRFGERKVLAVAGKHGRRGRSDWEDDEERDHRRRGRSRGHGSHNDWDKSPKGDHHQTFENHIELPTTLKKQNIEISVVGLKKRVDISINHQARVLLSDGLASNGVFHAIDNVLIPKGVDLPKLTWHNSNQECTA